MPLQNTIRSIVYVWSQHDGVNIEQWTIGYGWRQNLEAKLKIVGEQCLDPEQDVVWNGQRHSLW